MPTRPAFFDYLDLTKPRLTLLALATALSSFYISMEKSWDLGLLLNMLLGAALVGGGANALNQYFERNIDARMRRTEKRPLPSGRLSEKKALLFGSVLSLMGLLNLFLFVKPLTGFIGLTMFATYVFLYTPLKQKTPLNTFVGAIPGAMPCLIGWTAAEGHLSYKAWVLFLILFVWQLPHFLAISWIYQEDYKKGGLKMLSASDHDGKNTGRWLIFYSTILLVVSFLPTLVGITGLLYLTAAIFSGFLFVAFASYIGTHQLVYVKQLVPISIFYLAVINIFMLLDKTQIF